MKKWYRIFEIKEGQVILSDNSIANWYDFIVDAEEIVELKIKSDGGIYTVLPVYEQLHN